MAQPSSGTFAFQPAFSDLMIEAYGRVQIRPPSFTAQHMRDAVMSANLLMCTWAVVDNPNLWEVELISFPLVQGQATYDVPTNVVAILDYYIRTNAGQVDQNDNPIDTLSRTEYAAQPNKAQQAQPTTVWWDRTINSTLTLWPVPDGNGPYTLYAYAMTQMQDTRLPQGATLDLPYRFFEAFCAGLAAKLAVKYPPPPPNSMMALQQLADLEWTRASQQDVEDVPLYIYPGLSAYRV